MKLDKCCVDLDVDDRGPFLLMRLGENGGDLIQLRINDPKEVDKLMWQLETAKKAAWPEHGVISVSFEEAT